MEAGDSPKPTDDVPGGGGGGGGGREGVGGAGARRRRSLSFFARFPIEVARREFVAKVGIHRARTSAIYSDQNPFWRDLSLILSWAGPIFS